MPDESTPAPTQRDTRDAPEWYWILAFPLGILIRYLFRPEDLSMPWRIAWWLGSLVVAIVILWIVWSIGRRLRSS